MLESVTAFSDDPDSHAAGSSIGVQILEVLKGKAPDALILFASPRYDYSKLLYAVNDVCKPKLMVGSSSAGEFTSSARGEGSVSAIALRSTELHFTAGIGRDLRTDRTAAAKELVSSFYGMSTSRYLYRSALVLTDALAGHADALVEDLTTLTAGIYQFFGGGAGDDARFRETHLFYGIESVSNAVVALEILSNTPIGVGVSHGWQPSSPPMRVTESDGMRLVSVNAAPAVEIFMEHAERTGQSFDRANPLPFFLHNVLGIQSDDGYYLRVPLGVHEDGSVLCAADVPVGAVLFIMSTKSASASEAAATATRSAMLQLHGHRPEVALFFDCVATRLRMGIEFGGELETLQKELGTVKYAGFNTYGQIARARGEFSGFHNCTAVVCILSQ